MRNVLIPQGSEQTAKEEGGDREKTWREEIREPKRQTARKQDGCKTLDCPVWTSH